MTPTSPLESAMEANALARAVGWDDGYLRGRRDGLDAVLLRLESRAYDDDATFLIPGLREAIRIVTDLRDGEATS